MNKHISHILRHKPEIEFDVNNPEHVLAVMTTKQTGRQHATLRFIVLPPFTSIITMAEHQIALQYARQLTGVNIIDKYITSREEMESLISRTKATKISLDTVYKPLSGTYTSRGNNREHPESESTSIGHCQSA